MQSNPEISLEKCIDNRKDFHRAKSIKIKGFPRARVKTLALVFFEYI